MHVQSARRSPRPYLLATSFLSLRVPVAGGWCVLTSSRNVLVVSCCSLYVSYAKLCPIVQAPAKIQTPTLSKYAGVDRERL